MLLRSLLGQETAIRVRPRLDPALVAWGLRFLRECTAARARRNTIVKLRLCQYSQAVMTDLVRSEGIEYHAVNRGALYLFRDPRELDAGVRKMALLAEHGQRQEVLDPGQVARLDPAFEPVQREDRRCRARRRRLQRGLAPLHREAWPGSVRTSWA